MFIFANFTLALFMLNDQKLGEHIKIKIKYFNLRFIIIIIVIINKIKAPSISTGRALVCFFLSFLKK